MSYERYWREKINEYDAIRGNGNVEIRYRARRMHVICPKSPMFVQGAKQLLGRFRRATGIWTFDRRSDSLVIALCEQVWPGKVVIAGQNDLIKR